MDTPKKPGKSASAETAAPTPTPEARPKLVVHSLLERNASRNAAKRNAAQPR